MGRHSNKHRTLLKSAARARAGPRYVPEKSSHEMPPASPENTAINPIILDSEPEDEDEICAWTGGVNNHLEDDPEDWGDLSDDTNELDDEIEELEGEELQRSLEAQMAREAKIILEATVYQKLMRKIPTKEWKKAEMNQGFGYNGQSERSKRQKRKNEREKECRDEQTRKLSVYLPAIIRLYAHQYNGRERAAAFKAYFIKRFPKEIWVCLRQHPTSWFQNMMKVFSLGTCLTCPMTIHLLQVNLKMIMRTNPHQPNKFVQSFPFRLVLLEQKRARNAMKPCKKGSRLSKSLSDQRRLCLLPATTDYRLIARVRFKAICKWL